ncbi:hypothetical protein [Sutcliffiella deserti]|uniref:hypothetical protein n=1 Tax=Sutcliffiella deserti TaxID=2875501 RepID=UPI001CBFBC9A|nr:hypothetical protein [Sutcliffiella deserti]
MFVVQYFENRKLLLNQLRNTLPAEGEELTIKGRKGKVVRVLNVDERNVHVEFVTEKVIKTKLTVDHSKKKKR